MLRWILSYTKGSTTRCCGSRGFVEVTLRRKRLPLPNHSRRLKRHYDNTINHNGLSQRPTSWPALCYSLAALLPRFYLAAPGVLSSSACPNGSPPIRSGHPGSLFRPTPGRSPYRRGASIPQVEARRNVPDPVGLTMRLPTLRLVSDPGSGSFRNRGRHVNREGRSPDLRVSSRPL